MQLSSIFSRVTRFATDNSPAILTAAAVVGTVATAYLTGRAAFRAAEIIHKDEAVGGTAGDPVQRFRERAELTWREFILPTTIGACTITCVIFANRIGARRTAAALAAFAISEKALDQYKEKVVEKIGQNKEQKVRDEIAQDRVSAYPFEHDYILGDGRSSLCFDLFTGRPFISDIETLRQAQNDINHQLLGDMYVSLTEFYNRIGLEPTSMSDDFGWNVDRLMELEFSTALTPSGQPCVTMNFRVEPIRGYNRLQ